MNIVNYVDLNFCKDSKTWLFLLKSYIMKKIIECKLSFYRLLSQFENHLTKMRQFEFFVLRYEKHPRDIIPACVSVRSSADSVYICTNYPRKNSIQRSLCASRNTATRPDWLYVKNSNRSHQTMFLFICFSSRSYSCSCSSWLIAIDAWLICFVADDVQIMFRGLESENWCILFFVRYYDRLVKIFLKLNHCGVKRFRRQHKTVRTWWAALGARNCYRSYNIQSIPEKIKNTSMIHSFGVKLL